MIGFTDTFLLITINCYDSQWIFTRTLLPWLPRTRSIQVFYSLSFWFERERELLYYWRFTANLFVLATSPFRLRITNFILQLNTCCYSPYVRSSLTRGSALYNCCCSSPSQSFSDHILFSQIQDSPKTGGPGPRIYSSQEQGGPVISSGTWFPFRCFHVLFWFGSVLLI
jgi:hypothetical protein